MVHTDAHIGLAVGGCLLATLAVVTMHRWLRDPQGGLTGLDAVLLRWTTRDLFRVRDLLNGGVAVFGRSGSGKTSSSGKTLARAIVGRCRNSGGLILAAKPEDLADWRAIFAAAGRSADLLVFGPEEPLRCNFIECEQAADGETRNLVQFLRVAAESVNAQSAQRGRSRDPYWDTQEDRMLHNAIEIVKQATGSVTPPLLQEFILGAAQSPQQLLEPAWRGSLHCQLIEAAERNSKTPLQTHDFQLAAAYWLGEAPSWADRTRSSILAGVQGLLHVYNTGVVRSLVASETNIRPDDLLQGKWLLVNMSPSAWGTAGRFVCAGWKYLCQRAVLRRRAGGDDPIHVIWADEAQQFVSSFDAEQYLAQCRSHRGCMVFLSQSLPGYYAAFQGEGAEHQAQSLMANFATTIFHAVDPATAEWASKKLGRRRESLFGASRPPSMDIIQELLGPPQWTASFSEQYEPVLQENVFMNGLRTGGPSRACDAIVIRSGEPFSSGENYHFHTFWQE